MNPDFRYIAATEHELNDLVAGRHAGADVGWQGRSPNLRLSSGTTGVVWKEPRRRSDPIQPLALISREEEHRRLCGRFAQLRSDLSPLTAWCHLLTPQRFEALDSLEREAELGGYEAAWAGLVVAEALLLAERSIAKLRIAACLATQSFAVARAQALWGPIAVTEILERFDTAQRLFRAGESRALRLRSALSPIWTSLAGAAAAEVVSTSELRPVVEALRGLQNARLGGDKSNEAREFIKPISELVPEADSLMQLSELTPEQRLRKFDDLIKLLDDAGSNRDSRRRVCLALLAGYLATVAAGGAPSLSLTDPIAHRWPEVTAWAYVTGGIGERIVWTSSFDGLGRLVARELTRPLRLDEAPTCDVALDEAIVLVDPQLSEPLVHLRLKQARVVTIALLPGVNVAIPLTEATSQEPKRSDLGRGEFRSELPSSEPQSNDAISALADAIWPYLRARLEGYGKGLREDEPSPRDRNKTKRSRNKARKGSQSSLLGGLERNWSRDQGD